MAAPTPTKQSAQTAQQRKKEPPDGWVRLGHISAAHGIRGEVLIKPYTAEPDGLVAYGDPQDEETGRAFEIETARVTNKGVVARIVGINDRNAAEALKGTILGISREALPPPDEDEFYISDLIRCRVRDVRTGDEIGTVVAVHDFGAGDLLDVRVAGTRKTVLIPFTRETVPEVDMANRTLSVDPPPGLLDEPSDDGNPQSDADRTSAAIDDAPQPDG